MARVGPEVADIFRRYGATYRATHGASLCTAQRRVMSAIELCPNCGAWRIGQHMTALATYLGHVNIYSTYWYLQAAPNLLQDIADVGETFMGGGAQS